MSLEFDFIVWLDADVLIVNAEEDFRTALPPGAPIGMCSHPLPWRNQSWHYNSGVMVIRQSPLAGAFFERVWEAGPIDHPWFEQARILEVASTPQFSGAVQRISDK